MRKLYFILLFLLSAIPVRAIDHYVAVTGNDSTGDGSQGNPWATIGKADSLAQPGWTIHVAAGRYIGPVSIQSSGTSGNPITFISDTKWGAHLTITSGTDTVTIGSNGSSAGSWVIFQNFEVDGGTTANHGILVWSGNTKIMGNKVHDIPIPLIGCSNGGAGIDSAGYTNSNNHVDGNFVYNIGVANTQACGIGIYMANPNSTVNNNIVGNCRPYGIQLEHGSGPVDIINNTVFGTLANGVNSSAGITVSCTSSPCSSAGGVDNIRVNNNIVRNAANQGIRELGTTGTHNTYSNNLAFSNGVDFQLQNGSTATGTVSGDPLLANYQANGTGDYHLTSTSPAIDKGIALGAPATDFDGISRPQGIAYAIGAYEFPIAIARPTPPAGLVATVH